MCETDELTPLSSVSIIQVILVCNNEHHSVVHVYFAMEFNSTSLLVVLSLGCSFPSSISRVDGFKASKVTLLIK